MQNAMTLAEHSKQLTDATMSVF